MAGTVEQQPGGGGTGFDAEGFLKQLTRRPGVYRMRDAQGNVLYVGKARNLRSRVSSYFRARGLTARIMALVANIADIQVTVTGSETEALLLEQTLIKSLKPPYNIVLRDDKSYPWIYLTADPEFPRLCFHRGARRPGGRYFGPFPSAAGVRYSLNTLQKLFRLRSCEDSYFRNRSRPCLQHQIRRCSAPCVGLIDSADYQDDVRHAVMFLEGDNSQILHEFRDQMEAAAADLEFERAARIRDRIAQLARVQEEQVVHAGEGDVDVIAALAQPGGVCIQSLHVRAGRLLGSRDWFPRDQLGRTEAELVGAFISQYHLAGGGRQDLPRRIIVSHLPDDHAVLTAALAEISGHQIEIAARVRGIRARWLEMARTNAQQSLGSHLADRQNVSARYVALQEALGLAEIPERLECFDISHSHGEATVASCVVFDRNGPANSDYRRFNIEGVVAGDDYGAMAQALRRRYTRIRNGDGVMPDLLLIDGGKGQLSAALEILQELQIEALDVIGVAKGPERRAGRETLFRPGDRRGLELGPSNPALHLIQHIRDEAHRFAITGHRNRRDKARRVSELEGIAGIGPKRRRELLRHFGGLRRVRAASALELTRVPGISSQLAEVIYGRLHDDG